jgi:hypothetical protein
VVAVVSLPLLKGHTMTARLLFLLVGGGRVVTGASAQETLFDFDNAPVYRPLPITLTNGGVTAVFSGTGQGYSIQPANVLGFTPVGFAGNCIYPDSIYAADLLVSFSPSITAFSILYAPEEYACDSSATMRVTAYENGALVGTATTNAVPGTWPSETLAFGSAQGFNSVVVHYDAAPVTGGDYGPVFMADNMRVTAMAPPIVLTGVTNVSGVGFQFSFTSAPGGTFSILSATNLSLAVTNWTVSAIASEISPGQYQFMDPAATTLGSQFYRVRSP